MFIYVYTSGRGAEVLSCTKHSMSPMTAQELAHGMPRFGDFPKLRVPLKVPIGIKTGYVRVIWFANYTA